MGPHAADPVFLGANEGAPLLRDILEVSERQGDRFGASCAHRARHVRRLPGDRDVRGPRFPHLRLLARQRVRALRRRRHLHLRPAQPRSPRGQPRRLLGTSDADLGADAASPRGLLYAKPGSALPFSQKGNGFQCGPEYDNWLQNTALYPPDKCEMLTPGANESPFAGTGVRKILFVGNSYMFQQITALVSQYQPHIDMWRSPSMIQYWPSLSGEQRCACVGRRAGESVRRHVLALALGEPGRHGDGDCEFRERGRFLRGDAGPAVDDGRVSLQGRDGDVRRDKSPADELEQVRAGALAKALGVNLYELDAIYMNYGNYRGFGKLFCGGQVDDDVVKSSVGELNDAHVRRALMDGEFKGKLLLTTKTATEDLASEFAEMPARARGDRPRGAPSWCPSTCTSATRCAPTSRATATILARDSQDVDERRATSTTWRGAPRGRDTRVRAGDSRTPPSTCSSTRCEPTSPSTWGR